jgi:hypothetical protein
LDGTVLIAGSNPNPMPILQNETVSSNQSLKFPTEFRMERWTPPYLRGTYTRPKEIRLSTHDLYSGCGLSIEFEMDDELTAVEVILYSGGFVTHSLHMGQVMVLLETEVWVNRGDNEYQVEAMLPPDVKLAPGPYVVYILTNGVPGIGQFVTLHT